MKATFACCIIADDLLRRRHQPPPRRSLSHPQLLLRLHIQHTLDVVKIKSGNMPGSSARKERRRKERELSHAQLTSKVAYAESVADDGETGDNAAHTASNAQSDPDGGKFIFDPAFDASTNPSTGISPRVSSHDLPQETQRSPQRLEQSLLLSSGGKGALIRGKAYQKQSKSRSRRGAPPRVPRESEPPLGTVPQCPPSMYEEAMRALQGMTATDTAILRHTVMNEMAASGFSGNSRLDDAHRAKGPHKGSSTSSSRLTAKHDEGDIMTKREVENLRRAFMATISGTTDQNISDAPLTSKSKNSKSADSSVLPFGVNLDGAAHSVEIVQPNEDIPDGEEACIVQANESDEDEDIVSKLQGRKRTGKSQQDLDLMKKKNMISLRELRRSRSNIVASDSSSSTR